MAGKRSTSQSAARRAALDALSAIAARFRTETLTAALPLLTELSMNERLPATPGMVQRFHAKLRWLRLYATLRATTPRDDLTDHQVARWICLQAKDLNPDARVSPRSIRRWRDQYNAVGPDGLAAGPAGLLDHYRGPGSSGR